jgi:hypothetical protein
LAVPTSLRRDVGMGFLRATTLSSTHTKQPDGDNGFAA